MNRESISLVEPTEKLKSDFLAAAKEFQDAGDERYKSALENFDAYLKQLFDWSQDVNLKPHRVPESEFWLVDKGAVVGFSNLRHRLNPALKREGGHIGYGIRPSKRRQRYGTLILELTLEKAKSLGLKKVFLTCDADNVGSAKIIEKNGGHLAGRAVSDKTGKEILQYWIEI